MPDKATPDVLCIGHAAFDLCMAVSSHPSADEKCQAHAMQQGGGGPSANAAVTVARLGGKAAWCGYLSNDIYGDAHMAEFTAEGVDTSLAVRGRAPSPLSLILAKPDGKRTVVNFKEQTPWLPADALNTAKLKPACMLFDGHEPLLSATLMWHARKHGIPTVLDAGSLHRGTEELAPQVDYLVASKKFARQFADTDDMQKALAKLAAISPCAVITLGDAGLIWARNGETGNLPAFKVDAIDSTGAGDAFHGAFALGVVRNMAWPELLRFASAAGALTCTKLGARAAIPNLSDVQALLKK